MEAALSLNYMSGMRDAVALAVEMEQIRDIYGDECLAHVQRRLHTSTQRWPEVLTSALAEWEASHRSATADEIAALQDLGAF